MITKFSSHMSIYTYLKSHLGGRRERGQTSDLGACPPLVPPLEPPLTGGEVCYLRSRCRAFAGLDNRWLVTVNSGEARDHLLQHGLSLFNKSVSPFSAQMCGYIGAERSAAESYR